MGVPCVMKEEEEEEEEGEEERLGRREGICWGMEEVRGES